MNLLPALITIVAISLSSICSALLLNTGLHDMSLLHLVLGGLVMSTGAAAHLADNAAARISGNLLMVAGLLLMVLAIPSADNWMQWAAHLGTFFALTAIAEGLGRSLPSADQGRPVTATNVVALHGPARRRP